MRLSDEQLTEFQYIVLERIEFECLNSGFDKTMTIKFQENKTEHAFKLINVFKDQN